MTAALAPVASPDSAPTPLALLREQLAAVTAPVVVRDAIATGIATLDRVLPAGGIPCGQLSEILGTAGSGKTTFVRSCVAGALQAHHWVAYIDATRTLAPGDWTAYAATGRLWIIRPPTPDQGAWCADVLLRSGTFGMVILDGTTTLSRSISTRLVRLARDSNAALLIVRDTDHSAGIVGSVVRIRMAPASPPRTSATTQWRSIGTRLARAAEGRTHPDQSHPGSPRPDLFQMPYHFSLTVEKGDGGKHSVVEVSGAIQLPHRLCTYPQAADRRGVAARNRRGERPAPDAPGLKRSAGAPPAANTTGATLPRKRRFAEPAISRDAFLLAPDPTSSVTLTQHHGARTSLG